MQSFDSVLSAIPATRMNAGLEYLERLVRNPADPEVALTYLRSLDGDLHAEMVQTLKTEPEGRRLLEERPRLDAASINLDELGRLPSGTLGQVFARFFRERGLKPFVSRDPIKDDADYLTNRLRETHDLWHLITGYGTHPSGEIELQAFSYGNMKNPSSLLILSYVPGVNLRRGESGMPGWLAGAYRRGQAAKSLVSVMWEDHWDKPVAALRTELRVGR
jgi:ubiquinone biosynthesis protein COQ4